MSTFWTFLRVKKNAWGFYVVLSISCLASFAAKSAFAQTTVQQYVKAETTEMSSTSKSGETPTVPEAETDAQLQLEQAWHFISLEDALKNQTAGALTALDPRYAPVSHTIITREQIRLTPARNILDLLEIYIPGAVPWLTHVEGAHPGMRGIISDRNTKFLLIVDKIVMNQRAHGGVISEINQWDLNDIETIDVIRGPGSVVYGPGATMGVINITTRHPDDKNYTEVGSGFVGAYNSLDLHLTSALAQGPVKAILMGSIVNTLGVQAPMYSVAPDFLLVRQGGVPADPGFPGPTKRYFADFMNQPDMKLHLRGEIGKSWQFWARFTSAGSTNELNSYASPALSPNSFPHIQPPGLRTRQLTLALANETTITPDLVLASTLSYGSMDVDSGQNVSAGSYYVDANLENGASKRANFREDTILLRSILDWLIHDGYQLSIGAEYTYNHWGTGWFDRDKAFRMGDNYEMVHDSSADAVVYKQIPKPFFVSGGWGSHTISGFAEANLQFMPEFQVLLSGRVDANSFSKAIYSPRIALTSNLGDAGIIKLVAQQSVRMDTAETLLRQHREKIATDPETLKNIELIYNSPSISGFSANVAGFLSDLRPVGWNLDLVANKGYNLQLGDLRVAGLELEGEYKNKDTATLGINHALVKQLSFKLNSGTGSGISYADFNRPMTATDGTHTAKGVGNSLANYVNNITKLYATVRLPEWGPGRVFVHVNLRIFWGMDGELDGLRMLANTARGTAVATKENQLQHQLKSRHVYEAALRASASITYNIGEAFQGGIYLYDLANFRANKRYQYDAGQTALYASRVAWVEEPFALGVRADYKF